jgi:hypothetical protein
MLATALNVERPALNPPAQAHAGRESQKDGSPPTLRACQAAALTDVKGDLVHALAGEGVAALGLGRARGIGLHRETQLGVGPGDHAAGEAHPAWLSSRALCVLSVQCFQHLATP